MVRVKDATVRSRSFLGLRKCNTLWSHDASDLSEKASRFQITPRARARSLLPRPAHLHVARKQPRAQASGAGGASVATAAAKAAGPDVPKGWEKVSAGELHYFLDGDGRPRKTAPVKVHFRSWRSPHKRFSSHGFGCST